MGLTATPIYNITKDTNVTELEDTCIPTTG